MNLRHVRVIAKKELRGISGEKTILLVILLQLFLAMFSSFLIVGLAALCDPAALPSEGGARYIVGYVGEESGLSRLLDRNDEFAVCQMSLSTALPALRERRISAVILMPDTVPEDADGPVRLTLYSLQNDIQASAVESSLKEVFLDYEEMLRSLRSDRIEFRPVTLTMPADPGGGDFFEFVYGILIPVLLFMPAFVSSGLIIDMITEEDERQTLETLLSTSLAYPEIVWGKIAACFVIVPVQAGAWMLLLGINGIVVAGGLLILLIVSVASLFVILLGAGVALGFRERTPAWVVYYLLLGVVIALTLALPGNPVNQIVRLSVDSAGSGYLPVLAVVFAGTVFLGCLVQRSADRAIMSPGDA